MNYKTATFFFVILTVLLCFVFFQNNTDQELYLKHIDENYNLFSFPIPEKFKVFGERLPLEKDHVREAFDKEILVNAYWQSNTILVIKRANKWFPIIEKILEENNIPDDFKYLAVIESGLLNVRSPAGAQGFWQFMEPAAKSYGLEISENIDERFHIEKSTLAACKYLNSAYNSLGNDWVLAAASFNMGVSGVKNRLKEQKEGNYFDLYLNSETARYVYRIAAIKYIMESPEIFGYNIRPVDLYTLPQYSTVEVDSNINDLAVFSNDHCITYRDLKEHNPWLRERFLINKSRKVYTLKIPLYN